VEAELLGLQQQLLDAIARRDYAAYAALCGDDMTAFEPEAGVHSGAGSSHHTAIECVQGTVQRGRAPRGVCACAAAWLT
jgi:hypothetical protein